MFRSTVIKHSQNRFHGAANMRDLPGKPGRMISQSGQVLVVVGIKAWGSRHDPANEPRARRRRVMYLQWQTDRMQHRDDHIFPGVTGTSRLFKSFQCLVHIAILKCLIRQPYSTVNTPDFSPSHES